MFLKLLLFFLASFTTCITMLKCLCFTVSWKSVIKKMLFSFAKEITGALKLTVGFSIKYGFLVLPPIYKLSGLHFSASERIRVIYTYIHTYKNMPIS